MLDFEEDLLGGMEGGVVDGWMGWGMDGKAARTCTGLEASKLAAMLKERASGWMEYMRKNCGL